MYNKVTSIAEDMKTSARIESPIDSALEDLRQASLRNMVSLSMLGMRLVPVSTDTPSAVVGQSNSVPKPPESQVLQTVNSIREDVENQSQLIQRFIMGLQI